MNPVNKKLPDDARAVLSFWFGDEQDQARVLEAQQPTWWGGGAALDAQIAERFGAMVAAAKTGGLEAWSVSPRGHLARVILLDQFTRNVYRAKPEAFAGDTIARALALSAIDDGSHLSLRHVERVFLYLPLEHAEDLALQDQSVKLFDALVSSAPPAIAKAMAQYQDYAVLHRDIIARFGRFPHRNPVLGRAHTAEEKAWLDDGGPTFGQS